MTHVGVMSRCWQQQELNDFAINRISCYKEHQVSLADRVCQCPSALLQAGHRFISQIKYPVTVTSTICHQELDLAQTSSLRNISLNYSKITPEISRLEPTKVSVS